MNIGFEAAFYAVSEYQGCLEVCLIATGANLTRSAEVTLSTQNGSAIGKSYSQRINCICKV